MCAYEPSFERRDNRKIILFTSVSPIAFEPYFERKIWVTKASAGTHVEGVALRLRRRCI